MRITAIILLLATGMVRMFPQNVTILSDQVLENSYNSDDVVNTEQLSEDMDALRNRPLNLNNATEEQLHKITFLSDFQIRSLIDYRTKNGSLKTIYELKFVYGWDDESIQLVLPYVFVEETSDIRFRKNKVDHIFLTRVGGDLQKQAGYRYRSFTGDRTRILSKYYFNGNDKVLAGFSAEKDPGEASFKGSNKAMDFMSGYIAVKDVGRIRSFAAGDYHACFGQGLVLWTGFGFSKSASVMSLAKHETGFTKYSSLDENRFLRGAATTVSLGHFDVSLFYSGKNSDANVTATDASGKVTEVSSLQTSGLHRTYYEIEDERQLKIRMAGGNITWNRNDFRTGLTLVHTALGATLNRDSGAYNYFRFRGNNYSAAGLNYLWYLPHLELYGEAALTNDKEYAVVQGLSAQLSSTFTASLVYRNYSKGYYALYSKGFGEQSENYNEKGMFVGLQAMPVSGWKISGYADVFSFPWLRYSAGKPSQGTEYLIESSVQFSENASLAGRIKTRNMQENAFSDIAVIDPVVDERRRNERIQFSCRMNGNVSLRSRIEWCQYTKESSKGENGYFLYQDVIIKPEKQDFSLCMRYGIFDTDGYNSRIYAYENDQAYAFSMPAVYGRGTRFACLLKYRFRGVLDLGLKYGVNSYANVESVGTGLSEIQGNVSSDVSVQMLLHLR